MTLPGRKILPVRSRRGIASRVPIAQIAPKAQTTSTAPISSEKDDISDTAPDASLTFAAPPTVGKQAVYPNLFKSHKEPTMAMPLDPEGDTNRPKLTQIEVDAVFRIANKRKTGQENEPPFKRPDHQTHTHIDINIQPQTVSQEQQKPPQRPILQPKSRRGLASRAAILAQNAPKQPTAANTSTSSDEDNISDATPNVSLSLPQKVARPGVPIPIDPALETGPKFPEIAVQPLATISNKCQTGQENMPSNTASTTEQNNDSTSTYDNNKTAFQHTSVAGILASLRAGNARGVMQESVKKPAVRQSQIQKETSIEQHSGPQEQQKQKPSHRKILQPKSRRVAALSFDSADEMSPMSEKKAIPAVTISANNRGQVNVLPFTATSTDNNTKNTKNNTTRNDNAKTALQHASAAGILASLRAGNASKSDGASVAPSGGQTRQLVLQKPIMPTVRQTETQIDTNNHPQPQEEQKRPHRKIKKPVSRLAQSQTAIPQTPACSKRASKTKSSPFAVSAAVPAKHDASPALCNTTRPPKVGKRGKNWNSQLPVAPKTRGRSKMEARVKAMKIARSKKLTAKRELSTQMMAIPSGPADPFKSQDYSQGFQALEQLFGTHQQKREHEESQRGIAASSQSGPRTMHLLSNAGAFSSLRPLQTSPDKRLQEFLTKPPERKPPPAPSWAKPREGSIGVINRRRSARIAAIQSHDHQATLEDTVMKNSVPLHQSPRSLKPITERSRTTKPRSPPRSKLPQFSPSDLPPVRSIADLMNENPDIREALCVSDRNPLDCRWEDACIEIPQQPRRRRNPELRPQNHEPDDIQVICVVSGCLFVIGIVFWILEKGVSAGFHWCQYHLRG